MFLHRKEKQMKSIRSRTTFLIVVAIVLATSITMMIGINDVVELGQNSSEQAMRLLSKSREKKEIKIETRGRGYSLIFPRQAVVPCHLTTA